MSTHDIGFYEDLTKLSFNYYQTSSNTYLISSSAEISHTESNIFKVVRIQVNSARHKN